MNVDKARNILESLAISQTSPVCLQMITDKGIYEGSEQYSVVIDEGHAAQFFYRVVDMEIKGIKYVREFRDANFERQVITGTNEDADFDQFIEGLVEYAETPIGFC